MFHPSRPRCAQIAPLIAAVALAALPLAALADPPPVGSIFYIQLENHNWTQPAGEGVMTTSGASAGVTSGSGFAPLFSNPAAPYLNSLINNKYDAGTQSFSFVPGTSPVLPGNSGNAGATPTGVSYANAYHSVLSTPAGSPPSVHPSEPNYIWQEAGSNYGVLNDNDPYAASNGSVAAIKANNGGTQPQHLTGLMQNAGVSWKSYQEDIDLTPSTGTVNQPGASANTSVVAPQNQWTVPLKSMSGTNAAYTNPYNGSHQYDFAAKHDGNLFFEDTNGSNGSANFDPSNPQAKHWAPLQQLQMDLTANTVAKYNLITPNQFNDMHTALNGAGSNDQGGAFTYNGVTWKAGSDGNRIALGDNFLSQIIPMIMASDAYKNNGAIVIWTDETEGTARDTFTHTLAEMVISPLARGAITVGGVYGDTLDFTHSSDIATLQQIFGLKANTASGYLGDAANSSIDGTHDLSDLFINGVIPQNLSGTAPVPEPASLTVLALGACAMLARRRRA